MLLTPAERDRLLIFTAAELARARRSRGLKLNVPETIALVADAVCEAARDGARHADARTAGQHAVDPAEVLPGVAAAVPEVSVEAVFDDGCRLVVVPMPWAVGGPAHSGAEAGQAALPDSQAIEVSVHNTAAVPITVSSHFHFFEANPRLDFDRAAAYGRRLAIPAGSAVRFDAAQRRVVRLVPIGGDRIVTGFSGLVDGPLDAPGMREAALRRAAACGYLGVTV